MQKPLILPLFLGAAIACAAPIDPSPREGDAALQAKWTAQHDNFVKRAKAGGIDILLLGDSITHRWPARLWDNAFGSWNADRFGIEGEQVQNLHWRLLNGELDGIRPKVVVFLIGTNNVPREYSADDIADTIGAMVKLVQEKSPGTRVLILGAFPRNEKATNIMRDRITLLNERAARFANGSTVRFLDLGPKLTEANGTISREMMPDFLHPSPSAYEIICAEVHPIVKEMASQ